MIEQPTLTLTLIMINGWRPARSGGAAQVAMWERITAALATLGPAALALGADSLTGASAAELEPEQLVEYEGMLVSANAAQRRRRARPPSL
jgi:hypothetical protein